MGFQFFREECYAKVRSQAAPSTNKRSPLGGRGKASAREIVAEAIRTDGASPHVRFPAVPTCLFGLNVSQLPAWIEGLEQLASHVEVKTKKGFRKQRSDTPILIGVVASFPQAADDNNELYVEWRAKTLDFMQRHYGTGLVAVLEHQDESFGHIHAFVGNHGRSVKPLHSGHGAAILSAEKNESKKTQADAYKAGCRALQDLYSAEVGAACGLARVGPRRRRKTRAEWQAEKQVNDASATATIRARKSVEESESKLALLRLAIGTQRKQELRLVESQARMDVALLTLRNEMRENDQLRANIKIEVAEKAHLIQALGEEKRTMRLMRDAIDKKAAALVDIFKLLPSALQRKLSDVFNIKTREPTGVIPENARVAPHISSHRPRKHQGPT